MLEPCEGMGDRNIPECRDSLHFQAGKDYMLNFLRIKELHYSTVN